MLLAAKGHAAKVHYTDTTCSERACCLSAEYADTDTLTSSERARLGFGDWGLPWALTFRA